MKILIIIILPVIYTYNTRKKLKKRQNKVKEVWIKIESLLKTRNDVIPELLELTEKYVVDDKTLVNINDRRNNILSSKNRKDKMANSNKLTNELGQLFAIAENYEDLKANSEFLDLQNKIHDTEDQLNKSKKKYNSLVLDYKKKINVFPSKIVAYIFKFKPVEIFEEEIEKHKNKDLEIEESIEVLEL